MKIKKTCWAACRVRHHHRQQPRPSRLQLSSTRAGTPSCKWTIVLKTIDWIIDKKGLCFGHLQNLYTCGMTGGLDKLHIYHLFALTNLQIQQLRFFLMYHVWLACSFQSFKCLLTVQFTNRPLPSVIVCCYKIAYTEQYSAHTYTQFVVFVQSSENAAGMIWRPFEIFNNLWYNTQSRSKYQRAEIK